ncbi:hypothetical protein POM88_002355 [Heracleum sosnowskyi]|uniref:Deoxyuridine 5'-triphosphate nucleotidohydrolase n=1 Tax=Heracleum sosnowskyi TaxID=360622 RepID=A0AAD8N5U7_9APIA|nr:hypothetical protein POM88_002355 [Heracleum sosnowskyi]
MGSPLSAGYDLSSASEIKVPARGKALVPTDLIIAVPEGTYARIAPRSGLAWKHSIDVGAGVIDADYRGPVGVILFNYSDVDFEVKAGDRIAQLIIAIFPHFSCASLFVKTPYFVLKYQGRISRKYTVLPEIYFSIAFKDPQAGVKPPGVWKTFLGVISQVRTTNNLQRYFREMKMMMNLFSFFIAVAYITMTAAQEMEFAPAPGPVAMQSAATYPVCGAVAFVSLFVALVWQ